MRSGAAGTAPRIFLRIPAEAGDFAARRWRSRAMRCCSRARAACTWRGRSRKQGDGGMEEVLGPARYSCCYLCFTLRTALPVGQPVPRLPLHHLSHGVRQPDGAVPVHRAGALADRQAARVSDRAIHPRGRAEIAPEEGRHAHHGRRADHHFDRGSDAAVGGPALSLRVDRASRRWWRTAGIGFMDDYAKVHEEAQPGADGAAQAGCTSSWWRSRFAAVLLVMRAYGEFHHRHEHSVPEAVPARRC